MPESKIDQVLEQLKILNTILLGNGTPERGIVYRLAHIEEKFGEHLESNNRDGNKTRKTDLQNRPKWQKFGIVVALVSLVLGNLATIGFVLNQVGKWLSVIPK